MKDRKLEDYQIILTIRVLDGSEDHVLPSIQDGMDFDEEIGEGILHYDVQKVEPTNNEATNGDDSISGIMNDIKSLSDQIKGGE